VKRVDLVRQLEQMGCVLVRHGRKHDWCTRRETGMSKPVPRHRNIDEQLAKSIIKRLSDPTAEPDVR
jgi:HicA toxin of bacterial toxin-antitoxin,